MTLEEAAEELPLLLQSDSTEAVESRLTGGKGSSLAKLTRLLGRDQVPYATFLTSEFCRQLLTNGKIQSYITKLDVHLREGEESEAEQTAAEIRSQIEALKPTPELEAIVRSAVSSLRNNAPNGRIAVRSSGLAEDGATAAFAGQFETYLNVSLDEDISAYVLKCLASAFLWRVIHYREDLRQKGVLELSERDLSDQGFMCVVLQRMISSEKSGVAFSIDPDTGNRNVGVIQAIYGLGEMIVQGKENASWTAFTKTPDVRILGTIPPGKPQEKVMLFDAEQGRQVVVRNGDKDPRVISPEEARLIAQLVKRIEEAYECPVDTEYAIEAGRIYIVQARPETVHSTRTTMVMHRLKEKPSKPPVAKGVAIGTKIASGPIARVTEHQEARRRVGELNEKGIKPILVTPMTTPDWEPIMSLEKVSAIVCVRGNRTSHAAIVSRERGIPCAVGVEGALDLENGMEVTLDCTSGEARLYAGRLPFEVDEAELKNLPTTKTKILVNIGTPDEALKVSQLPSQGSSLVRIEFVVTSTGLHPLFAIKADLAGADRWSEDIKETFPHVTSLTEEYVERLKTGMAVIAAAFYPRKVIVRFSDFKTNEYGSLPGGIHFEVKCKCGTSLSLAEPQACPICKSTDISTKRIQLEFVENNPMLGYRGASRYIHQAFKEAFKLELEALIKVHQLGLTNATPMVPFVRTLTEAKKVTGLIRQGFEQQKANCPEIYFMAEVPSVCLLSEKFAKYCDGFSIGSNDLTQLTLGIDRDCETLAWEFDEADPAVTTSIRMLCKGARASNPPRKVGICGQAPSDKGRDFIRFLVMHLDTIGVNPDKVLSTILLVNEIEQELAETMKTKTESDSAVARKLGISRQTARYLSAKLQAERRALQPMH